MKANNAGGLPRDVQLDRGVLRKGQSARQRRERSAGSESGRTLTLRSAERGVTVLGCRRRNIG